MSTPEAKANELEKDLKAIEAEYVTTRDRYLMAIQALRGIILPPSKEAKKAEMHPKPALLPLTMEKATPELGPSRSFVVNSAIRDVPGAFTTTQLRDYIVSRHPRFADSIKGSYLPTFLSAREKEGIIKKIGQAEGGGPNKWVKINP